MKMHRSPLDQSRAPKLLEPSVETSRLWTANPGKLESITLETRSGKEKDTHRPGALNCDTNSSCTSAAAAPT